MKTPRLSVFSDCNSESIVIRMPHSLCIDMLSNCVESDDKKELIELIKQRVKNKKFKESLIRAEIL